MKELSINTKIMQFIRSLPNVCLRYMETNKSDMDFRGTDMGLEELADMG